MCSCQNKVAGTRRRTGRTGKAAPKRKVAATGPAKTIKVSGIGVYKHVSCSKTKTAAAATAEAQRKAGKKARVVKSGTTYCVYSRGKANAAATTKRKATRKRA